MDDKKILTTEYESREKREETASARGVAVGAFFGVCFWLGAFGCFRLLA
jgi:hypothetical protein